MFRICITKEVEEEKGRQKKSKRDFTNNWTHHLKKSKDKILNGLNQSKKLSLNYAGLLCQIVLSPLLKLLSQS